MLQRIILLITFAFMLIGLFLISRSGEHLAVLALPLPLSFLVFFLFPRFRGLIIPAMGILAIYFVSKIVTSELATGWFLLQGASMLIPLGGFFGVCRLWESDLRTIQSRSEAVKRATEEIRLSEQESLREQDRLEREVNEIVGLFELAREFNECIDLNEIVQVLSKQVFNRIPFERGKLVFLDEEVFPSNADRNETIWQGQVSSADTEKMQELSLEREVIRELTKRQAVVRFDTPAEDKDGIFKNHAIRFPLWIFPLVVGGEVTAAFWVEGARQEDFDKFEIIASQLALHVKKVKLYSKVKELSIVDGLTQLFVRRHFLERFRDELVRSIKYRLTLVVLLLDIDHFKQYNDTYGHLVGDVALRQVAQTIREVIRRVDIAARYGGEEFALVLPETDLQGGLDAAERIRSRIAKRIFRAYDEETRLTVSIGLTVFHGTTGNLTEEVAADDLAAMLLKQADEALYRAKEEGRNHVVVYQQ